MRFLGEKSPVGGGVCGGGDEAGTAEQEIKILRTPLGHPDFVEPVAARSGTPTDVVGPDTSDS